jgi:hypothetical protein
MIKENIMMRRRCVRAESHHVRFGIKNSESSSYSSSSRLLSMTPYPLYFFSRSRHPSPLCPLRLGVAMLDMTSRCSTARTLASAAVAAGQEGDDDAAEGDDAVDDGREDSANAADDGHDGVTDGPEEAGDARDDGTHDDD